ncbi:MAG: L-seryl-tRNA(Ser) seleniumtransferase [Gammaproteobacteria bacterium]|jgi:L-seryl-tRNA(Ser) seleniumtransferase
MISHESQLRTLPSVDLVLRELSELIDQWGHQRVANAVRLELNSLRETITSGLQTSQQSYLLQITDAVAASLTATNKSSLLPVFNLTGTVLHTNLGRAVLPESALDAVLRVSKSASNLEYDLEEGSRGDRDTHVDKLICELTGAEAATVVNNNAAAVLLTLNTLGNKKEVPVSRGELVEIGGSFRMPEIITSAGCVLVEVGTTNRTHLKDYAKAINDNTAMLLKVHASNYRIEGFTSEVKEADIAQLAQRHHIPFVIDLGSGNLCDFSVYGLPDEPTVAEALATGTDLVTFSGDKLLGGPQCGIIAGRQDLISKIKKNPLKRALRLDKMTLAALAEVLKLYQNPSQLQVNLPTLALLTRTVDAIREQTEGLVSSVATAISPRYSVKSTSCASQVGSGALPTASIPSYGLSIKASDNSDQSLRAFSAAMRRLPMPVIGRVHNGEYLLDCRCLDREADFIAQLDQLRDLLN